MSPTPSPKISSLRTSEARATLQGIGLRYLNEKFFAPLAAGENVSPENMHTVT